MQMAAWVVQTIGSIRCTDNRLDPLAVKPRDNRLDKEQIESLWQYMARACER